MNESTENPQLRAYTEHDSQLEAQLLTFTHWHPSPIAPEDHESSAIQATTPTEVYVPTLSNDGYMAEWQNDPAPDPDLLMLDSGISMFPANLSMTVQEMEPRVDAPSAPAIPGQIPAANIYNFPQANCGAQHPGMLATSPNAPANIHPIYTSPCGNLPPTQYLPMPALQMSSSNSQMLPPPIPPVQAPTLNPQVHPSQMLPPPTPPLQTINPSQMHLHPFQVHPSQMNPSQMNPSQIPPWSIPPGTNFDANLSSSGPAPARMSAAAPSAHWSLLPINPIREHGWIPNDLLLQNFGPRPPRVVSTLFGYYSDINEFLRISNPNWHMWTTHTEGCFSDAYSLLCSFHIAYESNDPTDIWFNSWLELQMKEVADYLRSDMVERLCCRGGARGKSHRNLKALARACHHKINCVSYGQGLEGCPWREQWDVNMLIGSRLYRKAKAAESQLKQRIQYSIARKQDIHARQIQRDILLLRRITCEKPTAHLQHQAYMERQTQREKEIDTRILQAACKLMKELSLPLTSFNNPSSFLVSGVPQNNSPTPIETRSLSQPSQLPPEGATTRISPMRDPPRGLGMADLEATELSLD